MNQFCVPNRRKAIKKTSKFFVTLFEILIFLGFKKILDLHGINSLNKSAIIFVMSIK